MDVTAFDFSQPLAGTRILLRVSLNVPVENGVITNTYRIREALPSIEALAQRGARVVVCAHIGRRSTDSLAPVWQVLKKELTAPIFFANDVVGVDAEKKAAQLQSGEVLLLENVRRERGEEKNDFVFAKKLAAFGSVYINDAFADSHRRHASIVGVTSFLPHYAGPNVMREMERLGPAQNPPSPSLAVIGGAKFFTKEPLLCVLLQRYDAVFVGGAIANDFIAARGLQVGRSLTSGTTNAKDFLTNSKLFLPVDVEVAGPSGRAFKKVDDITPEDSVLDIGPETLRTLEPLVHKARFILWNGPLGNFEKGFSAGTETLVRFIASSKASSVVGGGDTVAAIERLKLHAHFTHVSSAGGAMLQFISDGTLVGLEALKT